MKHLLKFLGTSALGGLVLGMVVTLATAAPPKQKPASRPQPPKAKSSSSSPAPRPQPSKAKTAGTKPSKPRTSSTKPPSLGNSGSAKSSKPRTNPNGGARPPSLGKSGNAKSPSLGKKGSPKPPNLAKTRGTNPPSLRNNSGARPPSLGKKGSPKPPSLAKNSGRTPPSPGKKGSAQPPSLGKNGRPKQPSLARNGGGKSQPSANRGGPKPPSLAKNSGRKPPSLGKKGGAQPPSLDKNGRPKQPFLARNGGAKPPSLAGRGRPKPPQLGKNGPVAKQPRRGPWGAVAKTKPPAAAVQPPRRNFSAKEKVAARSQIAAAAGGRGIAGSAGDSYSVTLHDKWGNVSNHDYFSSYQEAKNFADWYSHGVYSLEDGAITKIDPIKFTPGPSPKGDDAQTKDLINQAKTTLAAGDPLSPSNSDAKATLSDDFWKPVDTLKGNWVDLGDMKPDAPAAPMSGAVMSDKESQQFLTDNKGLADQVKNHEGVRDGLYLDSKGVLSGGIGRNMETPAAKQMINSLGDGADYASMLVGAQRFSRGQMDRVFATDLARSQADARTVLGSNASSQAYFDGLSSQRQNVLTEMAFNVGSTKLTGFTNMLTNVRNGAYQDAAKEMIRSKWYGDVGGDSPSAGPGTRAIQLVQQMGGLTPAEQKTIRQQYLADQGP